jgi:predicted RNase H-like HicB family nuclease
MRLEFVVKLPVKFIKKRKWYVATCPALDVVSQGETKKKAKENLAEALFLFLITCLENGTLDNVLKQCGFRPAKRKLKKLARPQEYLNIPIPLISSPADNVVNTYHS